MDRIQRMFSAAGSMGAHPQGDAPLLDTAEQVYISSLALLKMLKHGIYTSLRSDQFPCFSFSF
jgi:26S proteasome regulatory subunit N11